MHVVSHFLVHSSSHSHLAQWLKLSLAGTSCVRGEGVQGVFTLFCSGAAQVCHDDRVVELKEQLEVEEEDEDRMRSELEP